MASDFRSSSMLDCEQGRWSIGCGQQAVSATHPSQNGQEVFHFEALLLHSGQQPLRVEIGQVDLISLPVLDPILHSFLQLPECHSETVAR